jgi:pimeloyl-ACP methyl ester carboxylesterase
LPWKAIAFAGGDPVQTFFKFTVGGFFLYILYCLLLFVMQRMMLFPRGMIGPPPEQTPNIPGFEKIWLNAEKGKVEAWLIPPAEGQSAAPRPWVIFAHGNGELIDFWPNELKGFIGFDVGVMLVEYPGYGRSGGKPSQDTITDAFVKAYDALVLRKDVDPSRIVLFGRSLGGGAVCSLAKIRPSAALILMSAFTSVRAYASKYLVPKRFILDPFDNLAVVKTYSGPILILHGSKDRIVPYRHGIELYRAAPRGKMITYDAGHNDCPPDWGIFWNDMESFLNETGLLNL